MFGPYDPPIRAYVGCFAIGGALLAFVGYGVTKGATDLGLIVLTERGRWAVPAILFIIGGWLMARYMHRYERERLRKAGFIKE